MKIVYHADNIIDANLVRSLLESANLMAFVNGEYLAGAMGEVPAAGLLTVAVADSDEAAGRQVVADFERDRAQYVIDTEEDTDTLWDGQVPDPTPG